MPTNSFDPYQGRASHSPVPPTPPVEEEPEFEDDYEETDFHTEPELLYAWEAKEYEKSSRTRNWYLIVLALFCLLIIYALFTNNLLMAVVVILFGVVGYLFEKKDPRIYQFSITHEGIIVHDSLYEFESLESFWIFYEPMGRKILSLKSQKKYLPYIHLPLGEANPVEIREILLDYLAEEKQDESLLDAVERFF